MWEDDKKPVFPFVHVWEWKETRKMCNFFTNDDKLDKKITTDLSTTSCSI